MDEGRLTPCCQTADAQEVDDDPTVYQCEGCHVFEQINALSVDNYRAWQAFPTVCTRFTVDQHVVGTLVAAMTRGWESGDVEDFVTRLSILYDAYYPPKRTGSPHGA